MVLLCSGAGEEVVKRTVGGSDMAAADGAEGLAVGAHRDCSAEADVGDDSTYRGCYMQRQLPPPQYRVVPLHWPLQLVGCSPRRLDPCTQRRAKP
jgi:hypothetical protein